MAARESNNEHLLFLVPRGTVQAITAAGRADGFCGRVPRTCLTNLLAILMAKKTCRRWEGCNLFCDRPYGISRGMTFLKQPALFMVSGDANHHARCAAKLNTAVFSRGLRPAETSSHENNFLADNRRHGNAEFNRHANLHTRSKLSRNGAPNQRWLACGTPPPRSLHKPKNNSLCLLGATRATTNLRLSTAWLSVPHERKQETLEVCRYGSNALRPVPLLYADALVQPLQERVFEALHVRLHVRLVAGRDVLRLGRTENKQKQS